MLPKYLLWQLKRAREMRRKEGLAAVVRKVPKAIRDDLRILTGHRWDSATMHDYFQDAESPHTYAEMGPTAVSDFIADGLEKRIGYDDAVLDVGCNVGRHLAHLHEHGFWNLNGVDVKADILEPMREYYPAMADDASIHIGPTEEVLPGFEDDRFAAVYTASVLMHHAPESEFVFDEIRRVASDVILTVEAEHLVAGMGYGGETETLRDYSEVFEADGFVQTERVRVGKGMPVPPDVDERYELRVFEHRP